jgi:hypothetical protein
MARSATYQDLRDDGERIRRVLQRRRPLEERQAELVFRDVRLWQLRCAVAIAVRSPRLVAEFRARAGALQEPLGRHQVPGPDWHIRLHELVTSWLAAISWAEQQPA